MPDAPDWGLLERLSFEAEAIGFHLTAHPLDAYAQALRRLGVVRANEVEARARAGVTRVKMAGTVIATKERITRPASRMAWVRISDASGSIEVTCFSEVLVRSRETLAHGSNVLVTAELKVEGEAIRVTAQDVDAVGSGGRDSRRVDPHLAAGDRSGAAHPRSAGAPGHRQGTRDPGAAHWRGTSVEIALPGGYSVTPRLAQALTILPGVERVDECEL